MQLPAVLNQNQNPGVPAVPAPPVPVSRAVSSVPTMPPVQTSFTGYQNPSVFAGHQGSVSNQTDSDSDTEIPSLALPFRAGSATSENFLPMISTEDTWLSDPEYR